MPQTDNEKIYRQLGSMISSGRTGHAFLLCGGSRDSRERLGMWLAETVLCGDELSHIKFQHGNHEDFMVVEKQPDRESIVKEQILSLIERIGYKPFGDKYAVLIRDAHLMNEIAQNKLLKGLEEPVSQVVFILLAEREDALLSTIRSRCTSFHLEDEKTHSGDDIRNTAAAFAALINDKHCYYKKKAVIENILKEKNDPRTKALLFLDVLEDILEEGMLSGDEQKTEAVPRLEEARKYLKQGQSVSYTLKQFCLLI